VLDWVLGSWRSHALRFRPFGNHALLRLTVRRGRRRLTANLEGIRVPLSNRAFDG